MTTVYQVPPNEQNAAAWAAYYVKELGFALVEIPPGTKGPRTPGWNKPGNYIDDPTQARQIWASRPGNGMGAVLGPSGLAVLDIDDVAATRLVFEALGLSYDDLLRGAPRIEGRPGRDKALFRAPPGIVLGRHSLPWPKQEGEDKPITVFELRAGDVQDVLPPTIHPDTGKPYCWRKAPWEDGIPPLPDALLELWQEWAKHKDDLVAMCPWAVARPAPAPAPRKPGLAGISIIDAFNAAHDVGALLEAHGYKPKGKRYLAPSSSTGLPGVNILPESGRVYSHHGSDPLADGYSHDAFDVFRILEHGGDTQSAVRAAAHLMGIPTRPAVDLSVGKAAADAIINNAARPRSVFITVEPVPDDLLTPPGILSDVARYISDSAGRAQPVFSVVAALSLCGLIIGRRYGTETGLRSNLYLVSVGPTGCGKNHPRSAIKKILASANLSGLLGGEELASGQALLTRVQLSPNVLFQLDEFGLLMQSIQSPTAGNHLAGILTNLIKLFSSASDVYFGTEYANQEHRPRVDIEYPCVHVHATTTGETFYDALGSGHVVSGYLNRLLVCETDISRPERKRASITDVPPCVLEWIHHIQHRQSEHNLQGIHPGTPFVVRKDPDAARAFLDLDTLIDAEMAATRGTGLDALWNRVWEHADKIALVVACADAPEEPVVKARHADWAIRFVLFWTRRLVIAVRDRVADSPFEQRVKGVFAAIQSAGPTGMTGRDLARHKSFRKLTPKEREDVLSVLDSDGRIKLDTQGTGGRTRMAWVATPEEESEK